MTSMMKKLLLFRQNSSRNRKYDYSSSQKAVIQHPNAVEIIDIVIFILIIIIVTKKSITVVLLTGMNIKNVVLITIEIIKFIVVIINNTIKNQLHQSRSNLLLLLLLLSLPSHQLHWIYTNEYLVKNEETFILDFMMCLQIPDMPI